MSVSDPVAFQREYYARTAEQYDAMHHGEAAEHETGLWIMAGLVKRYGIKSILDVGGGTGRVARFFAEHDPTIAVTMVEPVKELRDQAVAQGLAQDRVLDGDAQALQLADGSFDLVCAFGILHHVPKPARAVSEMLRVARTAVMVSDTNNFGQGRPLTRAVKQGLNALGLWPVADWIKTKGKGYAISEGDGLFYSYSVFNNFDIFRRQCRTVHVTNLNGIGVNPYRTAQHVGLFAVKR